MARVMDHIADQYDGPVGSDPPTWDFPRMGAGSDKISADAANFRRSLVGSMPHDDEDGISDEKKLDSDPEEAYTAVRSVVSIPKQAAEEAQENPKVAELNPRLFSGVANKNPPDCGRCVTARIKLKPNRNIFRHREYQFQGDRAVAMKKLFAEFIERGLIEPSDNEWASPAFLMPKEEKGEWRLVVDYRSLNEQTEHDSYSLPLINTILHKRKEKADLHGVRPEKQLLPDAATPGLQALHSDVDAAGAHAVESGADGRQEWHCRFPAHDGEPTRSCPGLCRPLCG